MIWKEHVFLASFEADLMFCRAVLAAALVCTGVQGFIPSTPIGAQLRLSHRTNALSRRGRIMPRAVATGIPSTAVNTRAIDIDLSKVKFSGLNGIALEKREYPTKKEVMQAIPEKCFKRNTALSLMYAAISTGLTLACVAIGWNFIPLQMAFLPLWILYAAVTGTVATGCWVIAHECGHGAFSDNKLLQDTVGYILHTALLVPYMSWQRSHAVHHAFTNHITLGETHVPYTAESGKKTLAQRSFLIKAFGEGLGGGIYALKRLLSHLIFG